MKILHIINNLGTGGAERLISDLLPLMNEHKNIEIELLVLNSNNSMFEEKLRSANITIHSLNTKTKSILNVFKLSKFINNNNYEIVHAHLFPTLYYASIAKLFVKNKKIKFYYTEHSTNNKRRNKSVFKFIEKNIYARFDKVICISIPVKESLQNWIGENKLRAEVIYNGIEHDKFENAKKVNLKEQLKIEKSSKLICMIGRFNEAKDHKTLIDAFSNLEVDTTLILIGSGNTKSYYENYVKSLNIKERVRFVVERDDIPNVLKSIDIFVLSSNWEGFGLVAIEAMASGVPVIASDIDGLKQVVGDGAILFKKNDHKDLLGKLTKVLKSETEYDNLKYKGISRAKEFSINNTSNKYLKLYKEGEGN